MTWNPNTKALDLGDPPPFLVGDRTDLGDGSAALGHRIPWALLGKLLNRVLAGRIEPRLVRALLSLGPDPVEEAALPFEAALAALAGAGGSALHTDDIADAVETVEARVFSLPLNLTVGPIERLDAATRPWTAGGADPLASEAMDALPDDVGPDGACRRTGLGGAQRARESLMCALNALDLLSAVNDATSADLAHAVAAVATACAAMAKAWTEEAGLPLDALAPPSPGNFVPDPADPTVWRVPGCRLWHEHLSSAEARGADHAAVATRVAKSVALSRIVQHRALTCDLPVFQETPDTAPAPPRRMSASAAASAPRPAAAPGGARERRHHPRARQHAIKHYGWTPDVPDIRDHLAIPHPIIANLPPSVDLRPDCPPVYAQGEIGSCTANAIAAAIQFERRKAAQAPAFMPSRLFIYYNERVMENTVGTDSGAQLRDGLKSISTTGVCDEADWPYDPARLFEEPSETAYDDAERMKLGSYLAIEQDAAHMKACLAAGHPFVFGFSAYTSFESDSVARSGVLDLPDHETEVMLGGHAVMAVGYEDSGSGGRFIVRNSWGDAWGLRGYFTMPYAYLTDPALATNFWRIELPTDKPAPRHGTRRPARKTRGRGATTQAA